MAVAAADNRSNASVRGAQFTAGGRVLDKRSGAVIKQLLFVGGSSWCCRDGQLPRSYYG